MTDEKKNTIDLTGLDTVSKANDGFDVDIFHPKTREDTGLVIRVLGRDSDTYRDVSMSQQRSRMKKLNKGSFRAGSVLSPEEMESNAIKLMAECTVGWFKRVVNDDGEQEKVPVILELGGESFPFSVDNARKVYRKFPTIREQVDEAMDDRANFI